MLSKNIVPTVNEFSILGVEDKGKPEEVLRLKVLKDTNLMNFMVYDTTFSKEGEISNELRHLYIFKDHPVKEGDYIRLFTGSGDDVIVKNDQESMTHKIYWNLGKPIWNKEMDQASLVKICRKSTKKV